MELNLATVAVSSYTSCSSSPSGACGSVTHTALTVDILPVDAEIVPHSHIANAIVGLTSSGSGEKRSYEYLSFWQAGRLNCLLQLRDPQKRGGTAPGRKLVADAAY